MGLLDWLFGPVRVGDPPGAARRARERGAFGWWTHDEAASTLVREDGARLRYVGPAGDDAALALRRTGNRRWLRFDLQLDALAYPLLVERRDVLDPLYSVRRLVWRLDHVRSARLRGAEPPEPALWREVDRVAVDALYCWPEQSAAGVRPAEVAVSGGWRNGEWTPAFHRAFGGAGVGANQGDRVGSTAPLGAPRRWAFVPAERPESPAEAESTYRALVRAAPSEVAALLPALARGRPHLRTEGALLVPLLVLSRPTWPEVTVRWLYADETLITDRLKSAEGARGPGYATAWTFELQGRECVVGSVDRRSGAYVDFASRTGGYAYRGAREGGLFAEHGTFPEAALAAFREVVAEAVWCWPDATLALPDLEGAARDVRIVPPAVTSLWPATQYGGSERATSMTAAARLDPAAGYTALAAMFADDDGYAPAVRAPRVGRFDFDGAAHAMRDADAGRALAFERTLDGSPDAADAQLGLFRYADAEGSYPLVVRRAARTRPDAAGEWTLDHEASAARWRAETGAQGVPPQARWRRVAGVAFDALLVWPDTEVFGPAPGALVASGGWWCGEWTPAVRRRADTPLLTERAREALRAGAGATPSPFSSRPAEVPRTPGTPPPDPEPTRAWRRGPHDPFDDVPLPALDLDPPDAVVVEPVDLAAFAAARLSDRPYWLRADGGALLYVCGHEEQNVGPDYAMATRPVYEYADADVRVRLRVHGNARERAPWMATLHRPRVVRTSPFAAAGGALPAALFLARAGSDVPSQPHPRLWHRLVDAVEAWLDPARTGRRAAVVMRGGYVAGALDDSIAERRVWFDAPDDGPGATVAPAARTAREMPRAYPRPDRELLRAVAAAKMLSVDTVGDDPWVDAWLEGH
jgi:hypothetical protein